MVQGSTWCFTLIRYICVRFECPTGIQHPESFVWENESNFSFSSRESAQTYCNTQSNAQSSRHTTRGSNYASTSHAPTNNDTPSPPEIACPFCVCGVFMKQMNISAIYEKAFQTNGFHQLRNLFVPLFYITSSQKG
ncbi:alginate lyase [Striga asiatica]|uniref:Alginate lyase n=1 Tax=Striga asiatica TaxID=4170 RepID=A0A5A7RCT2_STRAF|nr:alginate lyase [Striga asiatica]